MVPGVGRVAPQASTGNLREQSSLRRARGVATPSPPGPGAGPPGADVGPRRHTHTPTPLGPPPPHGSNSGRGVLTVNRKVLLLGSVDFPAAHSLSLVRVCVPGSPGMIINHSNVSHVE